MASSWGAGLEQLGAGLMKYGMMQMEEEKTLEREARADQRALNLAKQKAEMEAALQEAAEKRVAGRISEERTTQRGLLQESMGQKMGLPELERLQAGTTEAWRNGAGPEGPVIRSGPEDEQTALSDMTRADREIYTQNLAENLAYARAAKPSERAVDFATERALRGTGAGEKLRKAITEELAIEEAYGKLSGARDLDTALKQLRYLEALDKLDPNSPDAQERRLRIRKLEQDLAGGGGGKVDKPTAAESSAEAAAGILKRMQVTNPDGSTRRLTNVELGILAEHTALAKTNNAISSTAPLWVRNTIKMYGGADAVGDLFMKSGGRHLTSADAGPGTQKPWEKKR